MPERDHHHELLIGISSLAVISLIARFGFPKWVRDKVKENQHGLCASCGEYAPDMEIHHVLPHSLGGSDFINNAVGLCGPSLHDCHDVADHLALEQGVLWDGRQIQVPHKHR